MKVKIKGKTMIFFSKASLSVGLIKVCPIWLKLLNITADVAIIVEKISVIFPDSLFVHLIGYSCLYTSLHSFNIVLRGTISLFTCFHKFNLIFTISMYPNNLPAFSSFVIRIHTHNNSRIVITR